MNKNKFEIKEYLSGFIESPIIQFFLWLLGAFVLAILSAILMVICSIIFTLILAIISRITGIEAIEVIAEKVLGKLLGGGVLLALVIIIREEDYLPFPELPVLLGGLYGLGVAIERQLWWF